MPRPSDNITLLVLGIIAVCVIGIFAVALYVNSDGELELLALLLSFLGGVLLPYLVSRKKDDGKDDNNG